MLAALLWCISASVVLAVRPAQPDDVLSVGGKDISAESLPLPTTCDRNGTIVLEAGMTYHTEVGNQSIDASCHERQGALGARILSFGGVKFKNANEVTIRGPLSVTMAPGLPSLSTPALRSAGKLGVVSPEGTTIEFKDITSSGIGAGIAAQGNISLEGPGSMLFQNLHTVVDGAGAYSPQWVHSTVAHLVFRNCSAGVAGGAIHAFRGVYFNNNGTVVFDRCTSLWRGGAVGTRASVKLMGMGTFVFRRCSSAGSVLGGGAVSAMEDVVVQLSPGGSASFQQCKATSPAAGGSGGAIWSRRSINISSGFVEFSGCSSTSGQGHAMTAANGGVHMAWETRVKLADMQDFGGWLIHASSVIVPTDSDVLPRDVSAEALLATKPAGQSNNQCPAGSRFQFDADGYLIEGVCEWCSVGQASLALTSVEVEHKVLVPQTGMQLVLMRGTSPNVFKSFNDSIRAKYGRTESQTCADDSSCLGITKGSVGIFNFHGKIVSGHRPQWGYDNKLAFTFTDAGRLEADDGDFLAVPADLLAAGVPVYLIRGADKLSWPKSSHSDLFLMDKNGIISPQLAPKLAFGIDHDVTYTFRPRNPHEACLPCHQLAPELFDKIQCDGGTQVQSAAGYMILHTQGSRKVHVHKCPNKAACPGSKLRLTAEGQTSSRSVLCAEGYQRSPGCILCSPGYGRPPLDPFICQACGSASHVQQISLATLASGIFFAIALNSARPRRGTQQIFKVFLAFLTISCRSLSAVPYTLQFQRLKGDLLASAKMLSEWIFALEVVINAEPGSSGANSFDCWGVAKGPVDVISSLGLSWSIPSVLLLLSLCCLGPRSWLHCLVVWGNVFIPALMGAAARLMPCFSTQEHRERILMYNAAYETQCASTLQEMLGLQRFRLAVGTASFLILIGPILWLWLAARDPALGKTPERQQTVGFLVTGYKPWLRWWEVTVLARKSAIFIVATWFPMSFAPGAHLAYLLLIVVVAELVHSTVRPYSSPFLNRLEGQALGISSVCVVLVISLLVEWPFKPYAIYVGSCAILFLLTAGVYSYFFYLYICALLVKEDAEVQRDTEDSED